MMSESSTLLVSDTSHRLNWGARSASLALQELLDETAPGPLATLPGQCVDRAPEPIDPLLPAGVARPLVRRRWDSALCEIYTRMESRLGMVPDFACSEPSETARIMADNPDHDSIAPIVRRIRAADIVIVDGDGDLILRSSPSRIALFNLGAIELASSMDKEVHYVNSILSDCPITGRNEAFLDTVVSTLRLCETVVFRDEVSLDLAESVASDLAARYIPDSLFYWFRRYSESSDALPDDGDFVLPFPREQLSTFGRLRFDEPYICMTGSSRARGNEGEAIEAYKNVARSLEQELTCDVYLLPTCSGDQFLHQVGEETGLPVIPAEIPVLMGGSILRNASMFVTGRYHPAILASLSGTPSVFLGADSHKTSSLQETLDYPDQTTFSAFPTEGEAHEIVERAGLLRDRREDLAPKIRSAANRARADVERLPELIYGE